MWLALSQLLFSWRLKHYLKSKFWSLLVFFFLMLLAKSEKLYGKAKSALLISFTC